jgi:hypothetical protein
MPKDKKETIGNNSLCNDNDIISTSRKIDSLGRATSPISSQDTAPIEPTNNVKSVETSQSDAKDRGDISGHSKSNESPKATSVSIEKFESIELERRHLNVAQLETTNPVFSTIGNSNSHHDGVTSIEIKNTLTLGISLG